MALCEGESAVSIHRLSVGQMNEWSIHPYLQHVTVPTWSSEAFGKALPQAGWGGASFLAWLLASPNVLVLAPRWLFEHNTYMTFSAWLCMQTAHQRSRTRSLLIPDSPSLPSLDS